MLHVNQNRLIAIAFRWTVSAIFSLCVLAISAPARAVQANASKSITGVYNGTYTGAQGPTKFKLSITQADNGTLAGDFTLYVTDGSGTKEYTCDIKGRYIAGSRMIQVLRGKWETQPPAGIDMPGMNGVFDPAGANGAGQISGKMRARPAPTFEAIRDPDESAKLANANKKDAGATPAPVTTPPVATPPVATPPVATPPVATPPVATPASPPSAPPSAAPSAPSSPSAPVDVNSPTAINGVYTGSYDCVDGAVKAKLIMKGTSDGTLTGVFTFDLPAWAGARPATYKLTGKFVAGNRSPFQFTTIEPVGKPAPDNYVMTAVNVAFRQGALVQGKNGMEYAVNPDRIYASTPGKASVGFDGTRDKTETGDLDKLMEAQASAAVAPSTAAPAAPVARLHSIDGVYNGTFEGKQPDGKQGPIKFKLTIEQVGGAKLAGVCSVYLSNDAGAKPATYSLEGMNDPRHHLFELYARDWNTVAPKDFEKTGFNGTFVADVAHNKARIYGPARFGPKFEATWDATESVDIKLAIANQTGVPLPTTQELAAQKAAHDAAMTAHYETVEHAPPKELASKDLVRKSKTYWDDYQTDMLREVFDGGFGAEIDQNLLFEEVFCTYVDMFSQKCPDCFPGKHETVVVTRYRGSKDANGQYQSVPVESWTVEVDSRLAPKYRQFVQALSSGQEGLRAALNVAARGLTPQQIIYEMLAPARDMDRFFANHPGKSAVMRQMTENFLRGATGEPSLQQSDGKIEGAAAETDKDLPPGKYARFVDGANAWYRDPANAKYAGKNDTAFCQALAELSQFKMTREEEYYYANDFKSRYYDVIMQPKDNGTDPEWSLLHPVVVECVTRFR